MNNKVELNENEIDGISGGGIITGNNSVDDIRNFMRMVKYTDVYYLVKKACEGDKPLLEGIKDIKNEIDKTYLSSPSVKFNVTLRETAPKVGKNFVKILNDMLKDIKKEN